MARTCVTPSRGRLWCVLEVFTAKKMIENSESSITDIRITGKASQLLTGDKSQELAREELMAEAKLNSLKDEMMREWEDQLRRPELLGDAELMQRHSAKQRELLQLYHNAAQGVAARKLEVLQMPASEVIDLSKAKCSQPQDEEMIREKIADDEEEISKLVVNLIFKTMCSVSHVDADKAREAPGSLKAPGSLSLSLVDEQVDLSSLPGYDGSPLLVLQVAGWLQLRPEVRVLLVSSSVILDIGEHLRAALYADLLPKLDEIKLVELDDIKAQCGSAPTSDASHSYGDAVALLTELRAMVRQSLDSRAKSFKDAERRHWALQCPGRFAQWKWTSGRKIDVAEGAVARERLTEGATLGSKLAPMLSWRHFFGDKMKDNAANGGGEQSTLTAPTEMQRDTSLISRIRQVSSVSPRGQDSSTAQSHAAHHPNCHHPKGSGTLREWWRHSVAATQEEGAPDPFEPSGRLGKAASTVAVTDEEDHLTRSTPRGTPSVGVNEKTGTPQKSLTTRLAPRLAATPSSGSLSDRMPVSAQQGVPIALAGSPNARMVLAEGVTKTKATHRPPPAITCCGESDTLPVPQTLPPPSASALARAPSRSTVWEAASPRLPAISTPLERTRMRPPDKGAMLSCGSRQSEASSSSRTQCGGEGSSSEVSTETKTMCALNTDTPYTC